MKKYIVIVPMVLALGGCLQGGSGAAIACSDGSDACLQFAFAAMAAGPDISVPGEFNRNSGNEDRSTGGISNRDDRDDGAAGNEPQGANTGVDRDDNANVEGDDEAKGNKGKKDRDRNQNAIDKGDNRHDKAGNAEDARR